MYYYTAHSKHLRGNFYLPQSLTVHLRELFPLTTGVFPVYYKKPHLLSWVLPLTARSLPTNLIKLSYTLQRDLPTYIRQLSLEENPPSQLQEHFLHAKLTTYTSM